MSARANSPFFECDDCGSPAFEIPGPLSGNAAVRCAVCYADLGPCDPFLDSLRDRLENPHTVNMRDLSDRRGNAPLHSDDKLNS